MRIAINCRCTHKPRHTGIGRNTLNLLDCLGRIDQENEYLLYCPKRLLDLRPFPRFVFSNFKMKYDLRNKGATAILPPHDVYHIPSTGYVPDHTAPVIVTVHDMIYKTYPQSHNTETIYETERQMQDVVNKAAKIICTSENTRRDLHRFFDLPPERSAVVYNGVDHSTFFQLSEDMKKEAARVLKQKGITKPYILFVGTIEPRKNLLNVLRAMAVLKANGQFTGQLVVVGSSGWMTEEVKPLVKSLGLDDDVLFMGYVTDEELRYCYNLAEVFVYPSFYEGFGFPIVEAFCCGAAVVTSNGSCCPEIAGDAALAVDPLDADAIAHAIASILGDPVLKAGLQVRALRRAEDFSFMRTARETLNIYQKVHNEHHR